MQKSAIGLIGLATMGANLARNIAGKNFHVCVYNRTAEKTKEFIKEFGNDNLHSASTLKKLVDQLETPRKIILLVKAGEAVDEMITQLTPLLAKEDILIDLGNSHFRDTERRAAELEKHNLHFIGSGISGGEEGALHGPSIMPGGDANAYKKNEKLFTAIAADDGLGGKCVTHVGPGGSGHFVKMVHNGIEYGIMQLIAESYQILKDLGRHNNKQLAKIFTNWSKEKTLNSFLIEITQKILAREDNLIDLIKDSAQQKGTGKWTTFAAMDLGMAVPTITAAVDARIMSGDSEARNFAKQNFSAPFLQPTPDNLDELVKNSLELSTILTYIQGLRLILKASEENNWNLNLPEIVRIWRGGCIIRSTLLDNLQKIFSPEIIKHFKNAKQKNWRSLISLATANGIPIPATSASLAYYDSMIKEHLPQNLIQAQRDFFGAHGYEKVDKTGTFHTEWNQ